MPPNSGAEWQARGLALIDEQDLEAAASAFASAHTAFVAEGDIAGAASARGNQAAMDLGLERLVDAAAGFQAALALLAEADLAEDPVLATNLATALYRLGNKDEAIERAGRAALLAAEQGNAYAEGEAWSTRAQMQLEDGRNAEAVPTLVQAVDGFMRAGMHGEAAQCRVMLGNACYNTGDKQGAVERWSEALPMLRQMVDPANLVVLLSNLGGTCYELKDHVLALQAFDEALEIFPEESRGSYAETVLLGNRGLALLVRGDFDDARTCLQAAVDGYKAAEQPKLQAHQLAALSNLGRYTGDLQSAIDLHEQVMALEAEHGFKVEEPDGLMYSALEDRSLSLFSAAEGKAKLTEGGRLMYEADTVAMPREHLQKRALSGKRGPVLMMTPPAYGVFGPLFPRGATAVASYLNAHGVPAAVLPLGEYVDDFAGADAARRRTEEVLADALDTLNPRAIGLSITFTYLYPRGREIAQMIKRLRPDIPIVMGGPHVTYYDRECLDEEPNIDAVVRGEGEWTALELFRALDAGEPLADIEGVTWRDPEGGIHRNKHRKLGNVLELPPTDFALLPADFAKKMEVSALTSRGCTFRCRYCHEFRYWGGVVREHPAERIVAEMEAIGRDLGNRMQGIDDSMLDMGTPYFLDLVDQLARSDWLPDQFGFLTRLDTVAEEGLVAMRKAGINSLSVGAESGSPRVLEAMNKGLTLETTEDSLIRAAGHGVYVNAFFIIGHPGSSHEDEMITRDFIDDLFKRDIVQWTDESIFTPYPGTPYYSHGEKFGVRILSREWSKWRRSNRPICELENYSADEIYLDYLRILEVQRKHLSARDAAAK